MPGARTVRAASPIQFRDACQRSNIISASHQQAPLTALYVPCQTALDVTTCATVQPVKRASRERSQLVAIHLLDNHYD